MKKFNKKYLILFVLLFICSAFIFYFIWTGLLEKKESETKKAESNIYGNLRTKEEQIKEEKERLNRGYNKFSSIELAEKESKLGIKIPKNTLGRNIENIFAQKVSEVSNGQKAVCLVYSQGLTIYEDPSWGENVGEYYVENPSLHFKRGIDFDREERRKGYAKSTTMPVLISINGIPGMGKELGFNKFDDVKFPYPGDISWPERNILYSISAWDINLSDLIKVAESMYE